MTEENILPNWFKNLSTQFKEGATQEFILYGNITDLVLNQDKANKSEPPYISFRQFLEKAFDERQMVIFYNIASGVSFSKAKTKKMKKNFLKITGLSRSNNEQEIARREIPREPERCLPLIERVLLDQTKTAVVISFLHTLVPNVTGGASLSSQDRIATVRLESWAQNEKIKENGNIVLLLTDQLSAVSSQLRDDASRVYVIYVPRPTKEEREEFLQTIIESKAFSIPESFKAQEFVLATQGLNFRQINDIFLRSRQKKEELTLDCVKERKREILNAEYGDLLEIVEPVKGLEDIGGLDHIKKYFSSVLEAIKRNEILLVPMGVTLMGPPGTGKTAIVEALAKEAKFNFVKTRNIRSMWVGESEGRMQTMISALKSLAPVVVMNDEADQMDNKRGEYSGDSGVTNRLRKMWMEFLSDPKIRGKVLVINCTNRPDLIDPALKRSGRSDERIPMLLPSREERCLIFKVMFRRYNIPTNIRDFSYFADSTEGLSGADIEKISLGSYRFAFEQRKKEVDRKTLKEAIDDFVFSADQKEIDQMTLSAIQECSSKKLLPENIGEIVERIRKRGFIQVNGNIEKILEKSEK